MTNPDMKEQLKARAAELGFDDCRVTSAESPAHADFFRKWLAEGGHGEMGYLETNAWKRVDPAKVLPEAKSIITLASRYFDAATEESDLTSARSALIARYAR